MLLKEYKLRIKEPEGLGVDEKITFHNAIVPFLIKHGDEASIHRLLCIMADSKREDGNITYLKSECCTHPFEITIHSEKELNLDNIDFSISSLSGVREYIELEDMGFVDTGFKQGDDIMFYVRTIPSSQDAYSSKRRTLTDSADRIAYVKKHCLKSSAFSDVDVVIENTAQKITFGHRGCHPVTLIPHNYIVRAKISSAPDFVKFLHRGLGNRKCYGLGMIEVIGFASR